MVSCWDMVRGDLEAEKYLRLLINSNYRAHVFDPCELAVEALEVAAIVRGNAEAQDNLKPLIEDQPWHEDGQNWRTSRLACD